MAAMIRAEGLAKSFGQYAAVDENSDRLVKTYSGGMHLGAQDADLDRRSDHDLHAAGRPPVPPTVLTLPGGAADLEPYAVKAAEAAD